MNAGGVFGSLWWIRNRLNLRKAAIALAVLLLAARFGQQPSLRQVLIFSAALGGALGLALLARWPELGLLAIVPVSLLARWEIGTGTKIPLNLTILLLAGLFGMWLLRMVVVERQIRLLPSRLNAPALAFILAVTVSLVAGNLPWIPAAPPGASLPAQLGGWLLYTFPMGLMLMVGNRIRDLRWLRALVWQFILFGGIVVLGELIPYGYLIFQNFARGSLDAMLWNWLAALAAGQALLNHELSTRRRIFLLLLVVAQLVARWIYGRQEWVSGWLPPLVAILVIIWLRSWRWGLALSALGALAVLFYYPALNAQVWTVSQQYSAFSRQATWPIMLELIAANPVFGLGPSNYYHYTPLFSLLGWYVKFNSHNNYVDIIAQAGLVGLGIFAWLVVEMALLSRRLFRRAADGFSRAYAAAALGGLAGMLVSGMMGDWFLRFVYNGGFPGFRACAFAWLFLGGLITLEHVNIDRSTRK